MLCNAFEIRVSRGAGIGIRPTSLRGVSEQCFPLELVCSLYFWRFQNFDNNFMPDANRDRKVTLIGWSRRKIRIKKYYLILH